jgi:hypothetical protein
VQPHVGTGMYYIYTYISSAAFKNYRILLCDPVAVLPILVAYFATL